MALNHIAQNTETADEFLNGITELMQELVARYQGISEEKKEQFQRKAKGEVIGKCPAVEQMSGKESKLLLF